MNGNYKIGLPQCISVTDRITDNNDGWHLLSTSYVLGIVLNSLHILPC